MWVFLSDAMLSIVEKPGDAKAGTLTVRARIAGDIERVFHDATVIEGAGTDYRFRATIPRDQVAQAMIQIKAQRIPHHQYHLLCGPQCPCKHCWASEHLHGNCQL